MHTLTQLSDLPGTDAWSTAHTHTHTHTHAHAHAHAHTHTQDDGSLQDDSAAEQEIIQRVMSRFFRDGAAGVSEDGTAGISEDADEAVSEDEAAGVSEDTDEETIEDVELPIKRGAAGATPRGTEAGWQEEEAAVALPGTVGNL